MGQSATVDVRDMLCAQALAVIAQAVERLEAGAGLVISYNAEDVRHDLLVWAREHQLHVVHVNADAIQVRRP